MGFIVFSSKLLQRLTQGFIVVWGFHTAVHRVSQVCVYKAHRVRGWGFRRKLGVGALYCLIHPAKGPI